MKDFLARLTSRKFILTIGGITLFVSVSLPAEAYAPIVALIGAYLASEGAGDVVQRYQAERTKQANAVLEDTKIQYGDLPGGTNQPDRSEVVSGAEVPSK